MLSRLTHLDAGILQAGRDSLLGVDVDELHLDLSIALGQQAVPHPVLVREIAPAPLVWVVLAQHAIQPIAAMIPASTISTRSASESMKCECAAGVGLSAADSQAALKLPTAFCWGANAMRTGSSCCAQLLHFQNW